MYRIALIALAGTMTPVAVSAQAADPAPAATASAVAPTVGATVYDTAGGTVGTIASIDGGNAVIDTGTVKAAVPMASIGTGTKGPTFGMTKAELEAAAGQSAAQAQEAFKSQLTVGANVYGSAGSTLGTIKSVDAEFVTLTTPKGDAKLPVGSFGPGPNGVTIGMTAEQLAAAMGK